MELFRLMSVFNFNIDITAPECTLKQLTYETKWWIVMQVRGLVRPREVCLPYLARRLFSSSSLSPALPPARVYREVFCNMRPKKAIIREGWGFPAQVVGGSRRHRV